MTEPKTVQEARDDLWDAIEQYADHYAATQKEADAINTAIAVLLEAQADGVNTSQVADHPDSSPTSPY